MEKEKDSKLKQAMKGLDSFLTTHYSFRYNQITEQCEFHDKHKFDKYRVVDEREFNTLVINAIEEGVNCMDRDMYQDFDLNLEFSHQVFLLLRLSSSNLLLFVF